MLRESNIQYCQNCGRPSHCGRPEYEDFREEFKQTAMKIQGSGWVYLSTGGTIKTIANHAVRTDICVLVDWWEHVWALDYQADKERYLDNIWKIIDWDVCNERL